MAITDEQLKLFLVVLFAILSYFKLNEIRQRRPGFKEVTNNRQIKNNPNKIQQQSTHVQNMTDRTPLKTRPTFQQPISVEQFIKLNYQKKIQEQIIDSSCGEIKEYSTNQQQSDRNNSIKRYLPENFMKILLRKQIGVQADPSTSQYTDNNRMEQESLNEIVQSDKKLGNSTQSTAQGQRIYQKQMPINHPIPLSLIFQNKLNKPTRKMKNNRSHKIKRLRKNKKIEEKQFDSQEDSCQFRSRSRDKKRSKCVNLNLQTFASRKEQCRGNSDCHYLEKDYEKQLNYGSQRNIKIFNCQNGNSSHDFYEKNRIQKYQQSSD